MTIPGWHTFWNVFTLKAKLVSVGTVLGLIAIVALGLWAHSCWNSHKAKLNEKQIIAAQQAIAKDDRKEMVEILAQSDAAEAETNATVANAKADTVNAIAESKKKAETMSNQELADELNRRAKE